MSRRQSGFLLLVIVAVAAGLRLWQIDSIPPGFHYDEALEGLEAWRILDDPGYRPAFLIGDFGIPPLNAYANALMFALFRFLGGEAGPTAMRVMAAIFGVLGVLAVYALAAEMRQRDERLPPSFPFLAAGALAVMRWHIHFSRMGIEPILVPLIWAAALALLLRAWRRGSRLTFVGAGVMLAAAMYAYYGAWVIPLLAALAAVHLAVAERERLRERLPGLLLAAGVAFVLILPLIGFFRQHPDLFLLRPSQVAAGDSAVQIDLIANLRANLGMFWPFGATGDLDPRRNLPGAPALNVWLALPFFTGLIIALRRARRPAHGLLLAGGVGLLAPGVVSEYAPHFHRILGAAAPAALFVGLGLAAAASWLGKRLAGTQRLPWAWIGAVILLLGGVVSAQNYFGRWARLPDLYYAFDVGLWEMGRWIALQPVETPIYLSPRSHTHPTLVFAWQAAHRPAPVSFDGRHIFPLNASETTGAELYAVIEHEDFRTPLLLPSIFPNAAGTRAWYDAGGGLYGRIYSRAAGTRPQRQPQHRLDILLGDGIRLLGYDTNPPAVQTGGILYLQLYWGVEAAPEDDWTVFTHVLGGESEEGDIIWAGHDSRPGAGSLPTYRWQPGWLILDEYQIPLPVDMPAGDEYTLEIGLYQPGGERLPAEGPGLRIGGVAIEP